MFKTKKFFESLNLVLSEGNSFDVLKNKESFNNSLNKIKKSKVEVRKELLKKYPDFHKFFKISFEVLRNSTKIQEKENTDLSCILSYIISRDQKDIKYLKDKIKKLVFFIRKENQKSDSSTNINMFKVAKFLAEFTNIDKIILTFLKHV